MAVAGILVITALMRDDGAFVTHGGLAAVALLTVLTIAGATASRSWLGRALDVHPLRWIGERSYGLYLWHWPVFVLFAAAFQATTAWWVMPSCASR